MPRGNDVRAKTIHNSPGLLVTGASAGHLLAAMKVFAGRRPDLDDIKHLAGILGIRRTSERLDVIVSDPSSSDEEHGAHERVLQRTTGDGVVCSIEQANEVINRYEREAAAPPAAADTPDGEPAPQART